MQLFPFAALTSRIACRSKSAPPPPYSLDTSGVMDVCLKGKRTTTVISCSLVILSGVRHERSRRIHDVMTSANVRGNSNAWILRLRSCLTPLRMTKCDFKYVIKHFCKANYCCSAFALRLPWRARASAFGVGGARRFVVGTNVGAVRNVAFERRSRRVAIENQSSGD